MHDPAKILRMTSTPSMPDSYSEIASLIARHAPVDGEFRTAIPHLFFSRRSSPTQPLHTAQWPCFALVAQGAKSLTLGEEVFRYGVGDYLLMALDLPVASRVTQASQRVPNLGLGMAIDPARLAELLRRVRMPRPPAAAEGMRGVAVNAASLELLDATLRLMRLLDRPADITALSPLIEEEILYWLLTGPDGARLLHIASSESRSHRVGKAIDWLRGHFSEPLSIQKLAEHVGMSESSLHHHFKAVTALTPVQYQKQLRLHEARRLLLIEKTGVATAGHLVGYQSPSQFSREYARLYGRSPLRDLQASAS
jgi:AraC-like DNA-binding protein